jgi:cysteine desulfurase
MKRIYLDYAATTPVSKKVYEKMKAFFSEEYGNPSSLHDQGRKAKEAVEKARENIKKKLNAKNHRLIFTSGGTESNNLAIKGLAFKYPSKKHIITTKIEHDCVLNTCKWLEKQGWNITYLNVDKEGFIDLKELEEKIREDTLVVSIIHANNEIGTIQDLEKIADICHKKKTLLHSDACQSFTKVPIDLTKEKVDLLTINSHKIYGPKGVGALIIRDGTSLEPLQHGGNHEEGIRSGTLNVSGIVGFGEATNEITIKDIEHMKNLRDLLIKEFMTIEDTWINGPKEKPKLCNIVNVTFKYAEGESILLHLDAKNISVSTGSACSSNSLKSSHVLRSLGLKQEDTHGSVRFSLGKDTTKEEIEFVIKTVKEIVKTLREMCPYKY